MRRNNHKIPLMILCAVVLGCASHPIAGDAHWRSRIAQVKIGMSRAEVEKLLPPAPKSPTMILRSGGAQAVTYWVDENSRVTIAYDYTGVPRDEKGKVLDYYSPQNRIVTAPELSCVKMPIREVKNIGIIEQPAGADAAKPASAQP